MSFSTYPMALELGGTGLPLMIATGINAYEIDFEGYTEYSNTPILVQFINGNTGGCTLEINGLGDKPIRRALNSIVAGDIEAGSIHLLTYDGLRFQLQTTGARLSSAQLSSVLTGLPPGSNTSITFADSILSAFGKAQAQINARIQPGQVITDYSVGTNTALVNNSDTWLRALGKLQGQINARLTTAIRSRQSGSTNYVPVPSTGARSAASNITQVDRNKSSIEVIGSSGDDLLTQYFGGWHSINYILTNKEFGSSGTLLTFQAYRPLIGAVTTMQNSGTVTWRILEFF